MTTKKKVFYLMTEKQDGEIKFSLRGSIVSAWHFN